MNVLKNMKCEDFFKTYYIDKDKSILVIDPPFNIGYHYKTYRDRKKEKDYYEWLESLISNFDKFVIIHYPESLHKLSIQLGVAPNRIVSWVYNSNTKRQHRQIAYYGFDPDFSKIKQPYKNPNDKRVKARIAGGSKGTNMYDWFNINQVKNVSKEKTAHPCQMPLSAMEKIVGIIPMGYVIVDCFMGSGTTGVVCNKQKRDFIGVEMDESYFNIAKNRIKEDAQ